MSQRRYGAVLSYVSMGLSLLVAFMVTPILVHTLGKGQYGLFGLMSSIAAYFLLMDVGLSNTVLRYVIRHERRGEREELATFIGTAITAYAVIVALLVALAAVGYTFLTPQHWPRLTPKELADFRFMYVVGLGSACAVLLTNPFSALLQANQRFVEIQTANIALTLLSTALALTYILGFHGQSVRVVFVLNNVVQASVCLFQVLYVLVRLRPPIAFRPVPMSYVREKLNFTGPIFLVVMVELVYWRLDNLLIGSILGTAALAVFTVGTMFQKYVLRLATNISRVMSPQIFGRLESGADGREAALLVAKTARMQALIVMPIIAGVIALGRDFLHLWLGPEFVGAYPVMLLTLIPYSFEIVGNVRNAVMQVHGLYWRKAISLLVFSVLNVGLTIYLLPRVGIWGAAFGTGVGLACAYVYAQYILQTRAGFDLRAFYGELFKGLWIVLLGLAAMVALLQFVAITDWARFVAAGGALVGVYALLVWLVGMNRTERSYLLSFARDAKLVGP